MHEDVVLVDESDNQIGTKEKLEAHVQGALHRALSVWVFSEEGKTMLQRRALTKYHSGGLWTNTCCSHPRVGEPVASAAHRRLKEEMGFDCPQEKAFTFVYKKDVGNDLWEHEYLHVFTGEFDKEPEPNPEEAMEYRWASAEEVRREVDEHPERFSAWFPLVLAEFKRLNLW